MSKLSPFLEGMLSAFILLPSVASAKANYIEPTDSNLQAIDTLSTHQPFIEVGLIMEQVAKEKHFLEQAK